MSAIRFRYRRAFTTCSFLFLLAIFYAVVISLQSKSWSSNLESGCVCSNLTWDSQRSELTDTLGLLIVQSCLLQEQVFLSDFKPPFMLSVEFRFNWLQNCLFNRSKIVTFTVIRCANQVQSQRSFSHPVGRLASQYSYATRHLMWQSTRYTAKQLVEASDWNVFMNDYTVRRILGMIDRTPLRRRPLSDEEVDLALDLLDNIDIVVPLERMCEARLLFRHVFNWTDFKLIDLSFPGKKNIFKTFNVQDDKTLTTFHPDDVEAVLANNAADLRLWNRANELFDGLLNQLPQERIQCEPMRQRYIRYDELLNDPTWGKVLYLRFRNTDVCLDHEGKSENNPIKASQCGSVADQEFHMATNNQLTTKFRDVCLTNKVVNNIHLVYSQICERGSEHKKTTDMWSYHQETGQLVHEHTQNCLELQTDRTPTTVVLNPCSNTTTQGIDFIR